MDTIQVGTIVCVKLYRGTGSGRVNKCNERGQTQLVMMERSVSVCALGLQAFRSADLTPYLTTSPQMRGKVALSLG